MARRIRGWLRNLIDGGGPTPNTVALRANVSELDGTQLTNDAHGTGRLDLIHVNEGSGDAARAAANGHFGWDMELSPGPIFQKINPTDPAPGEHRRRFPDESAQVGIAFHSDMERFGLLGGRDVLIWNGVHGGAEPASAANWSWTPDSANAYQQGNWGIAGFGSGGDAMKVTLRRGIGFVGGALFSVELGDLVVPVAGETPLATNGSGSDRWDLLLMRMDADPTSATYGKQSFEFVQGSAGAGIPPHPGQVAGARRMALYALKVAAGAGVYSAAVDLRRWLWHPNTEGNQSFLHSDYGFQVVGGIEGDSLLNSGTFANQAILPLGQSWTGYAHWSGNAAFVPGSLPLGGAPPILRPRLLTEGRGLTNDVVAGTNYAVNPAAGWHRVVGGWGIEALASVFPFGYGHVVSVSAHWPLRVIPSFHRDDALSPESSSRTWWRLRFRVMLVSEGQNITVSNQTLAVHLWPAG